MGDSASLAAAEAGLDKGNSDSLGGWTSLNGGNEVHVMDTIVVTASLEEELEEGRSDAVAVPYPAPFSWESIKSSAIRNYTAAFTAQYQSLKALLGLIALHNAMQEDEEEKKQDELEVDKAKDATKNVPKYGSTPKGRPLTKHYGTETGPKRNIPGSVVDNTIDTTKGVPVKGGKTVHYDPQNNVTVVTGDGQSIVSVHKGPPRKGQF